MCIVRHCSWAEGLVHTCKLYVFRLLLTSYFTYL